MNKKVIILSQETVILFNRLVLCVLYFQMKSKPKSFSLNFHPVVKPNFHTRTVFKYPSYYGVLRLFALRLQKLV